MSVGTKARNLIKLQELGCFVPEFRAVLFSDIVVDFMDVSEKISGVASDFLRGGISLEKYSSRAERILSGLKLDRTKVSELFMELADARFSKVSFRTSALGEDGPKLSFAGQYRTFLDKEFSEKNIRKYAKECFSSIVDARILQYLKNHKAKRLEIGGSVIIQQMFYGKKSGVLFTEDGTGHVVIDAVDSWRNTVVEGDLSKTYKLKKSRLSDSDAPRTLKELAEKAMQLENEVGAPLDIEWAVNGKKIAFLQMRPQTTHDRNYFFEWDNTNISESYPGITLPLTYSFIRNLYAQVYPAFLGMIGTPQSVLEENSEVFNNALGMLDGRVYYRISNWYEIIKLIPGKNNQQYFEAMLNPAKKRNPKAERGKMDLKSLYVMLRFIVTLLSSPRLSRKFKKKFNKRFEIYDNSKMGYMNVGAILNDIQSVQKELLALWAIPILNDVRVMIWHGMLRKTVTKEASHETYLELLRGLTYRSSIKPLQALKDLGVKLNDVMAEKKISSTGELAKNTVANRLVRDYVLEYGARTPDELKLENPRLVDSPEDVMIMALRAKDSSVETVEKTKIDLSEFSFGKRLLLRGVIKNTRSAIDWREHFRLNRAQVFNLARRAYLEIGEIFSRDKIINRKDDIFYLTDFEIENIINGHAWEYSAEELISRRKDLYKKYEKKKVARRVTGDGVVAARHLTTASGVESDGVEMAGMGVSPGTVKAKVVVATEFDANLDVRGKILVAPHIDPGWTLIFTQAIGVITERGNALSHVSIISRELSIPAVVALGNATKILKNGQTVSINGSTGEVIVDEKR